MLISPRELGVLVVLGPTASGKSALAVHIAQWARRQGEKAEIISADSRQIYRGLDIGTAKVPNENSKFKRQKAKLKLKTQNSYRYRGIVHHMIDVASPRRRYSSAKFSVAARKKLYWLLAHGYLPIICGGTAHYIDTLLGAQTIPDVPPDPRLRAQLEKFSVDKLFARLQKLDPARAATIERKNPRRLTRALEIVLKTGKPVPTLQTTNYQLPTLKIGISRSLAELRKRINARLERDMRRGLVAEVRHLHARGLSWARLDELGLEYRYVSYYLRGTMTRDEMMRKLRTELWRYAKRQMTWWKRDKDIRWVRNEHEALALAENFLHAK